MIRQYRIERFQGMEVLVCECFRKHTWTQSEYEAFNKWSVSLPDLQSNMDDFKVLLNEFLEDPKNEGQSFFGLFEPIPLFDSYPCLVLRGVVVDNKVASLQVDYVSSMLPPEIIHEISEFYGVFDSRHWRNMVSTQVEKYGSLFGSTDD